MNRLIGHIEKLLLLHDCVIIPDFGGFVLQRVSSFHCADKNMFLPPSKEVVFNQSLKYNDGLLAESYMRTYGMDFYKSQQLVRNDVTQLRDTLDNNGELRFGTTGIFVLDDERMVFMAAKNSDTLYSASYNYGLPIFHYLPLQNRRQAIAAPVSQPQPVIPITVEEKTQKPQNNNIVFTMPITKTFIRTALAAAAAILLFLLISTPVSDVNKESYRASFVPQEIMSKKAVNDIINDAFETAGKAEETEKAEKVENVEKAEKIENGEQKEKSEAGNKELKTKEQNTLLTEAKPSAVSAAKQENYYVIIGSFETKAKANRYIKSLKGPEAKTVGTLVADGRVRVYAQRFATEKSANSYMNRLRQTTEHRQAWTYRVKN